MLCHPPQLVADGLGNDQRCGQIEQLCDLLDGPDGLAHVQQGREDVLETLASVLHRVDRGQECADLDAACDDVASAPEDVGRHQHGGDPAGEIAVVHICDLRGHGGCVELGEALLEHLLHLRPHVVVSDEPVFLAALNDQIHDARLLLRDLLGDLDVLAVVDEHKGQNSPGRDHQRTQGVGVFDEDEVGAHAEPAKTLRYLEHLHVAVLHEVVHVGDHDQAHLAALDCGAGLLAVVHELPEDVLLKSSARALCELQLRLPEVQQVDDAVGNQVEAPHREERQLLVARNQQGVAWIRPQHVIRQVFHQVDRQQVVQVPHDVDAQGRPGLPGDASE
mmetsp:Transcript_53217/g.158615  ORF Transcript_53217/g.158615 Transcript_53217/m.158615 type:complete len:334 (-) Transcript_53217:866-1867(-)